MLITQNSKTETTPHPLDIALGSRIRLRRRELGMSQEQLARQIGITFQQVQKYEHGANRVSFSRLVEIAQALRCGVADLIGDLDKTGGRSADAGIFYDCTALLNLPGSVDLLRAFQRITNSAQRRAVLNLANQLAEGVATTASVQA